MEMNRRAISLALLLQSLVAVICLAWVGAANAQTDYPTRSIRFICSSAAGGTSDLITRAVAEPLSKYLRQPVVIDNMPGANGTIGSERAASAAPDGYTLFSAVDSNLVVNPFLFPITYDPLRDFVPISMLARVRLVLIVSSTGPSTLQELIAKVTANPGKLNYASVGYGSAHFLGMEEFKRMTKTNIVHIPFRGQASAIVALLGGQVDMEFASVGTAKPLLDAGKIKVLAVASAHRAPMLPQVPTMDEAGVPDFELSSWYGILAPAKTPPVIVDRLSDEIAKAKVDPGFVAAMRSQGLEIIDGTPSDMLDIIRADTKKWKQVIETIGIKRAE
jgi:tripartite-type tricarboxylate transporter receptor subunit TctC